MKIRRSLSFILEKVVRSCFTHQQNDSRAGHNLSDLSTYTELGFLIYLGKMRAIVGGGGGQEE